MAIVSKRFALTGPHSGRSVSLGGREFVNGVYTYIGSERDADAVALFLFRNFEAVEENELCDSAKERELLQGEHNPEDAGRAEKADDPDIGDSKDQAGVVADNEVVSISEITTQAKRGRPRKAV